jgi:hypothetical protein
MDLNLDCPHCGTAKAGFTGLHARQRQQPDEMRFWDVFAYCRICEAGVVAVVDSSGYNPMSNYWNTHRTDFSIERVHPAPPVDAAPEHTPDPIAKDFKEGLRCLRRGDFNAAGMMFRKTLQRATTALAQTADMTPFKAKTPVQHRIDVLAKGGHLTDSMRDLTVAIKLDGNEAAHEEDQEFDKDAVTQTREFTELFLIYAFTLPERVKRASQSKAAPAHPSGSKPGTRPGQKAA